MKFQLPSALIALAIPTAGIAAAVHRSLETQTQIKLTIQNNMFSNFIRHREEFKKSLTTLQEIDSGLGSYHYGSTEKLYLELFPNNHYGHLETSVTSSSALAIFDNIDTRIKNSILTATKSSLSDDEMYQYYYIISQCLRKLKVNTNSTRSTKINYKGRFLYLPYSEIPHVTNILLLVHIASQLHYFCHNQFTSYNVTELRDNMNDSDFQRFNEQYATEKTRQNKQFPPCP
ncbi:hypothetical protein PH586_17905 [Pseudomonas sp. SA3-5]|uniref:Uncharacterized protein n=1 Tax=Pseudomonas aestuarii TaxID=3018340 RepID=A0ABT4XJ93_9PSED|nr:hypothetical protein [Pseudomonas aestuarii]MDA7088263.1 hypothetical protein [Pseudomonas aestuarii]